MATQDKIKQNPVVRILDIKPRVGIPGGDVTIFCDGLRPMKLEEDSLHFCGSVTMIEGASTHKLVTHIPETTVGRDVYIMQNGRQSEVYEFAIPRCIAHTLHNVGNPAVSSNNKVFATFSGSKGQITPASVFRVIDEDEKIPIIMGLMNATSLLYGRDERLYIASRYDGTVYVSDSDGTYEVFSQGLGEAFGMAMDDQGFLYVGDRTGTVFKIDREGHADFFAQLPASPVAYHLAIDSQNRLYVTVPLNIGENSIYRISVDGEVEQFYTDLAEFHGITIDSNDFIFVAETNRGKSSVICISPDKKSKRRVLSGEDIVGLAFNGNDDLYVATFSRLYYVENRLLHENEDL